MDSLLTNKKGENMRKKLMMVLAAFSVILLVGCKSLEPKEFTGAGMTIELNDSFIQKEVIQAPLYLESPQHIFMGIRESKSELRGYGVSTTEQYIGAVLNAHGKTATVEQYNEGDLSYYYAYYTATVNEQTFGYMLFVLEGESHFYSMNFGCLEKDLEKNKTQYNDWIKTITVE